MNNQLITIIIPVYNAEKFLYQCIHSVVNQTYPNLELIFINDGSTDGTKSILNDLAGKYDRIRVVHKENEGPGVARNVGIDIATGQYIMFLDADDTLTSDCCENLVHAIQNTNVDFVCFGSTFASSKKVSSSSFLYKSKNLFGKNILINYLRFGEIKNVVWNKIYKKNLFDEHKIRFPCNRINEDSLFTMKVAYYSNCAKLIPGVFHRHCSANPFSCSNIIMPNHFSSTIDVLNAEFDFLRDKNLHESLSKQYIIHSAKMLTFLIFLAALNIKKYDEFLKCISTLTDSNIWDKISNTNYWGMAPEIKFRVILFKQSYIVWIISKGVSFFGFSLQ